MAEPRYKPAVNDKGIWRVVDSETGVPPVIRGVEKAGLSESEAVGIARWLNNMSAEGVDRRNAAQRPD